MKVAGTAVDPGERRWVELPVTVDADMRPIDVHCCVLNGGADGPTLWLQGNVHGDEAVGGRAVRDFVTTLDPGAVSGAVVATPVANPVDFVNKQRGAVVNNQEPRDAGRAFPGAPDGGFAQQLADALYGHVVDHADCVVEAHSPDRELVVRPGFGVLVDSDGGPRERSRDMARALDLEDVVELDPPTIDGFLFAEAEKRGIPGLLIESGSGALTYEWAYETYTTSLENVAKEWDVLDGDVRDAGNTRSFDDVAFVGSTVGGYAEPDVSPGERVEEGDPLGRVTNIRGAVEEVIRSPGDGVVAGHKLYPVTRPGDVFAEVLID